MAAPTKKVKNDLIPLKAGIVRLTPLDAESNPIYSKAITTKRNFLTSTAITTTRTSETLPNGNGSDKDFPTDEKYNLALVTQTFDPKFHNTAAGMLVVASPKPILRDTTITVGGAEDYSVDLTENEPAAMEDGKYYFEIRDAYGNAWEQTDAATESGKFKYDKMTKKLSFDATAANKQFSLVYYVAGTNGEAYEANPILQNPQFMLEIFGETQSAESGQTVQYYAKMPRAVVTGDLPNVTTQKSINAALTYNFSSAPVPQGMSAFYQSFTPVETA